MKIFTLLGGLNFVSLVFVFLVQVVTVLTTFSLFAKGSIYTKLKEPALIERFEKISDAILCQCGCHMPLSMCNHRACMAWAIRDAIDALLLQGLSNQQIIDGFIQGWGKQVDTNPAFAMARSPEYAESGLRELLQKGLGEAGRTEPVRYNIAFWILVAAFLIAGIAILYIRKKQKQIDSPKELSSDEKEKLLQELKE